MFDYSKALLIMPAGYDNYATALSSLNLLICCQYACNGNARINGMDRAGICAHSRCNGSCVEDRQATTGPGRGRGPLTDYYTLAGFVAMVLAAGRLWFGLVEDEKLVYQERAPKHIL